MKNRKISFSIVLTYFWTDFASAKHLADNFLTPRNDEFYPISENENPYDNSQSSKVLGIVILERNNAIKKESVGPNNNFGNTKIDEELKTKEDSELDDESDSDYGGLADKDDKIHFNYFDSDLEKRDNDVALKNVLRSCNKRVYIRCKKACIAAYKITCSEYACSSRLKRFLKRACKHNCRKYFLR